MAAITGCADDDGGGDDSINGSGMSIVEQQRIHAEWRVDMIVTSDKSNDMLADYKYDHQTGQLTQMNLSNRNKGNRIIDTDYEYRFTREKGLISKMSASSRYRDYSFGYDYEHNSETTFIYDDNGNLLHTEGKDMYAYDDEGRLVQTYRYEFEGMVYSDHLEWDDRGNVTRHICTGPESNMIEQPIPGSLREWVYEYEYDNNPKPNFGLGDSFFWDGRYNPWPLAGNTDEQLARTLSRNNLTRCEQSGHAYRYTYNDVGLPETVQTIWIGIDTSEPMVQTIVYKSLSAPTN